MRMTFLRRSLFGLTAITIIGAGLLLLPNSSSAATTKKKVTYTYVTKCTKYYVKVKGVRKLKWNCKKVKVAVASSYKPKYNVMTSLGSKRKLPAKLVAVCGDDKKLYSAVTSTSCKGHGGIAWCVNKKSSKYCPQY
jgi:hypothetical protein